MNRMKINKFIEKVIMDIRCGVDDSIMEVQLIKLGLPTKLNSI